MAKYVSVRESERERGASKTIVRSIIYLKTAVRLPIHMYMRAHTQTPRCGAPTNSQIRVWFQACDLIGKMASNCGEESGASSVFCGPILGMVQMFC